MKQLVIYHAHCTDGVAAAVAHRIAYERQPNVDSADKAPRNALEYYDYVPMNYGMLEDDSAFFEVIKGYHAVTFLDFCPTEPLLRQMLNSKIIVTIFDHHKTAYEMIQNFKDVCNEQLRVVFSTDNKLSGATLTWVLGLAGFKIKAAESLALRDIEIHGHKFLTNMNLGFIRANTLAFKDPLYNLIGIRDTWDESDPRMKARADALHAYLDFTDTRGFEEFYNFVKNETFVFNGASIVDVGQTVLNVNRIACENALKDAYQTVITTNEGDIYLAIGICPSGQGSQFGQSWREMNEGKKTIAVALFPSFLKKSLTVGFRSSGIDALRLASTFPGGGGHSNACGCRMSDIELRYDDTIITPALLIRNIIKEIVTRVEDAYGVKKEEVV